MRLILPGKKKFWSSSSPGYGKTAGGIIVPARVNSVLHSNGASNVTTVAATLSAAVGAGNLIVVSCGTVASTTLSVTDDKSNAYTLGPQFYDSVDGFQWASAWHANTTNAPITITATWGASSPFSSIIVTEFSGVLATSPLDGSAISARVAGVSGTNAVSSTSITTTASGNLIYASTVNVVGGGSLAAGTGFIGDPTDSTDFASEYLVQGSAGSVAGTFTNGSSSDSFVALVMGFKHA